MDASLNLRQIFCVIFEETRTVYINWECAWIVILYSGIMMLFVSFIHFLIKSNIWFIFPLLASTELIFSSLTKTKTYSNGNRQHRPYNFMCEARFVSPYIQKEQTLFQNFICYFISQYFFQNRLHFFSQLSYLLPCVKILLAGDASVQIKVQMTPHVKSIMQLLFNNKF